MQPSSAALTTCLVRCIRHTIGILPASTTVLSQKFIVSDKLRSRHSRQFSTSRRNKQLDAGKFYQSLQDSGVQFFCGVPDSLLKDFCAYVTTHAPSANHFITAHEGSGVALASGYYLATGKPGMVYLQNSGVGNMVNPLLSLADPEVYHIPMLLLVGWRGEPGVKDEPQHKAQGRVTPAMFDCMGIPSEVLPHDEAEMLEVLKRCEKHFKEKGSAYVLLVRAKTFLPYKLQVEETEKFTLAREEALVKVVECLHDSDAIVSTSGMLSRELFEHRVSQNAGHARDFLTVGSMGHALAIALGVALQKPGRQVFALEGDGAVIMHMGNLATIGQQGPPNLKHIVFNNGAHDSVGGQPTEAANHDSFDIPKIAMGCGYKETLVATTPEEIQAAVRHIRAVDGPVLLEVKIKKGSRADLGRPTTTTIENKRAYMDFLMKD